MVATVAFSSPQITGPSLKDTNRVLRIVMGNT